MPERPTAILLTREVFARMAEYLHPMLPGLCDAFIQGLDLGPAQESLTTVMLPALRSAAQTRARSTQGRGLILMDQRRGGAIWYIGQVEARAAFGMLPIPLWSPIDQLLQRYLPLTEVIVIRLAGRIMEVLYFDHDDMLNALSDGPLRIPTLPFPLVQEQGPGFALPPEVASRREDGPEGMSYIFTHTRLGELGRMLLRDAGPGQMHVTHVVAGSPADPMTAERQALLMPIVQGLSRHLELSLGHPDPGLHAGMPLPPDTPPMFFPVADPVPIATTIHDCAQCGRAMVFLIFADDPALTLEDYARKMFDTIQAQNLTTFVLGPAQGSDALDIDERPSALLEVWPLRKPVRQVTPPEFEALVAKLSTKHCKKKRRSAPAADRSPADTTGIQWQPLSQLPALEAAVEGMYDQSLEQHRLLLQARGRPGALDDATVDRALRLYQNQRDDLHELYREQCRRWQADPLTPAQFESVAALVTRVEATHQLSDTLVRLLMELKQETIEAVMRTSDTDLGLDWLLRQGKRR